jgi:hypothetical protein
VTYKFTVLIDDREEEEENLSPLNDEHEEEEKKQLVTETPLVSQDPQEKKGVIRKVFSFITYYLSRLWGGIVWLFTGDPVQQD